jgi:dihydroxy-acid dehydratase
MPEMHVASAALAVPELYGKVALISDTRVSGVSGGAVGVHCSPEAVVGGPIARVQDGDEIEFDLLAGTIEVKADLDARLHTIHPVGHPFGYLADFAATVTQAHDGCVPRWTLQRS